MKLVLLFSVITGMDIKEKIENCFIYNDFDKIVLYEYFDQLERDDYSVGMESYYYIRVGEYAKATEILNQEVNVRGSYTYMCEAILADINGDYPKSIEQFNKSILVGDDKNIWAYLEMFYTLKTNDYWLSVQHLELCIKKFSHFAQFYIEKAEMMKAEGLAQAADYLESINQNHSDNIIKLALGHLYLDLDNKYQKALSIAEDLKEGDHIKTNFKFISLVYSLSNDSLTNEISDFYTRCYSEWPNEIVFYIDASRYFMNIEHFKESVSVLNLGLSIDPTNEILLLNLMNTYVLSRKFDRALELIGENMGKSISKRKEFALYKIVSEVNMQQFKQSKMSLEYYRLNLDSDGYDWIVSELEYWR